MERIYIWVLHPDNHLRGEAIREAATVSPRWLSPSGDHGHTSRVKHNAAESAVIKLYEVSILLTFSADEATTATKKPHTDFVIFLLW